MCPDNYHNRLNFNKVFAMYNSDRVKYLKFKKITQSLQSAKVQKEPREVVYIERPI